MTRVGGHRPGEPAGRASRVEAAAAAAEELGRVYREILGRAPEHDLVPSIDRIAAVAVLRGDPPRAVGGGHRSGAHGKTSSTRSPSCSATRSGRSASST